MGGRSAPAPILPPLADTVAEAPPVATPLDEGVRRVREDTRRRAALSGGRQSTIVTSAQGLTTPAPTAPKSLLGIG
jgi:hypothetical protein